MDSGHSRFMEWIHFPGKTFHEIQFQTKASNIIIDVYKYVVSLHCIRDTTKKNTHIQVW